MTDAAIIGLLALVWFGVPIWSMASSAKRTACALEDMARLAKGAR